MLLEAGADPDASNKYGHSPLQLALRYEADDEVTLALVAASKKHAAE